VAIKILHTVIVTMSVCETLLKVKADKLIKV